MPQIVSWNVNSINSRLEHLQKFAREEQPDIILLQETKCMEDKFPYEAIEELGYNIVVAGQKSYNGVAILSKSPINDVTKALPYDGEDAQARYIEGTTEIGGMFFRVASVYVPNGQDPKSDKFQYKMKFFERLNKHLKDVMQYEEMLVVGGDYNVAPEEIDVYNPKHLDGKVGFHPDERKWFRTIINSGLKDSFRIANDNKQEFSWWDYRSGGWKQNKGMRIDQIIISPQACDRLENAGIYSHVRDWEKPSDHAPIYCNFS